MRPGNAGLLRQFAPAEAALVDIIANSLSDSDLTSPVWHIIYSTFDFQVRALTIADADFSSTPTYFLNYNRAATSFGLIGFNILGCPSQTAGTFTFETKLAPGDTTERFLYGLLDGAGAGFIGPGAQTVTLTNSWQTVSIPGVAMVPGTTYRLAYKVNDTVNAPTTTAQARGLVRNVRLVPTCSAGVFASPFTRVSFDPNQLHDAGTRASTSVVQSGAYGLNVWIHYALSRMCLVANPAPASIIVEAANSNLGLIDQSRFSVMQGTSRSGMAAAFDSAQLTNNAAQYVTAALGAGPYIDIINGNTLAPAGVNGVPNTFITIRAVYIPNVTSAISRLADPTNILVIGPANSLAGSFKATFPRLGWANLLRYLVSPSTAVVSMSRSNDTMSQHSNTAPNAAAWAALMAAYGANRANYMVEAITNDFGLNTENAATFGTYDAFMADAIHAADATGKVIGMLPFQRGDQNTPNGSGNILSDYTAQRVSVYGARPSFAVTLNGQAAFPGIPGNADQIHFNDANEPVVASGMLTQLRALGIPGF